MRRFRDAWILEGNSSTIICSSTVTGLDNAQHDAKAGRSHAANEETIRFRLKMRNNSLVAKLFHQALTSVAFAYLAVTHRYRSKVHYSGVLATVPSIPTAYSGWAISKLLNIPLIIDLRDAWPDLTSSMAHWDSGVAKKTGICNANQFIIQKVTLIGALFFEKVLQDAHAVITTSESLSEVLRSRQFENVSTIRNTYPANLTRRASYRSNREELKRLRILYAGTVGRAQGLSNAVMAVKMAAEAGADIELLVVGGGAELQSVKDLTSELQANVDFVDTVSTSQMQLYYDWADACLIHLRDWPALEHAVPSKLVEIMARGIPACVAANGEPAQIVQQTRCGSSVSAMSPTELAQLWTNWWRNGVPAPNHALTKNWLNENADPAGTASSFVRLIDATLGKG